MKIKAKDLKFGDMIKRNIGLCMETLVLVQRTTDPEQNTVTFIRDKRILSIGQDRYVIVMLQDTEELDVMRPMELTPAQQHADELLIALKSVTGVTAPMHTDHISALLDKIEPPKPVTLDEAMSMLSHMAKKYGMPASMTECYSSLINRYEATK